MKAKRFIPLAALALFLAGCPNEGETPGALAVEGPSDIEAAMTAAVQEFLKAGEAKPTPGGWVGFTRAEAAEYDEAAGEWIYSNYPPEIEEAWARVAKAVGTIDERARVEWIPFDRGADVMFPLVSGIPPETRVVMLDHFEQLEGERYRIVLGTSLDPLGLAGIGKTAWITSMNNAYVCERDASGRWKAVGVGGGMS